MNKEEARTLLSDFVDRLSTSTYEDLCTLVSNPVCLEIEGPSGVTYQIEYEALWDSEPKEALRVIASIDDGGLISAMMPISASFVVEPQGDDADLTMQGSAGG